MYRSCLPAGCCWCSASPAGPFVFSALAADAMPVMAHAGGADFSLLYDGDEASGDAYIAY
eukprot:SAG22_NODE_4387_length_1285_cov_1.333895_2_plen_59_part_01